MTTKHTSLHSCDYNMLQLVSEPCVKFVRYTDDLLICLLQSTNMLRSTWSVTGDSTSIVASTIHSLLFCSLGIGIGSMNQTCHLETCSAYFCSVLCLFRYQCRPSFLQLVYKPFSEDSQVTRQTIQLPVLIHSLSNTI